MDKVSTFTDIAREFNFDAQSLRKLFDKQGIKPAKTIKVGKRVIELWGDHAYGVAKAERERRDAVRAEKNIPSPVERIKAAKASKEATAEMFDDLASLINTRLNSMELGLRDLLAGMEARLGARYTGFPDFRKAFPPGLEVTCTGTDPNAQQYATLSALAEMTATVDD